MLTSKGHVAIFAALLSGQIALAQTQTVKPSSTNKDAEVYRLSPFEVTTASNDDATTVISATRFETAYRNLPVVVDVITEETLKEWQYTDLMEALTSLTSGISSAAAPRQAIIRGMPSDYAMRNGIPVTNFFGTAPLSRIEVVRGATGVLFGVTQPGGVRNMISKRPTDQLTGNISLTYDTADGNRSTLGVSGPLTKSGSLSYRFEAVYGELGDKYELDNRWRYDRLLYPALLWRPTPTTQVFLEFDNIFYSASVNNTSPAVRLVGENFNRPPTPNNLGYAISPSFDLAGPSPQQSQRVRLWNLVMDQALGSNWNLRGAYSWQLYNQWGDQRLQNSFLRPGDTAANVTYRQLLNRFRQEFARVDLLGQFEWGQVNHKMLIGADYVWRLSTDQKIWTDARRNANGTYTTNVYRVNFADYENKTLANNWLYDYTQTQMPLTSVTRGWVKDYGTYWVNQLELKKLKTFLLAGLRFDHMIEGASRPVVNYVAAADGRLEAETVTDHVNPQMGVVYTVSPNISVYANYSTSSFPNRTINPDGTSLDAETGQGFDAGVKFGFFNNRLSGEVNVFDMFRQNLPVADPAASTDPSRVGYFILIGEAESRGYEIKLNYQPLRGLTLAGSYTFIDAFETDDKTPLVRAYRHAGTFQASYRFASGALKNLSVGAAVASRSKTYFGQAGRLYAPSDDAVSARMAYPVKVLNRNITLQVNIRNVLDKVEINDEVGGGWGFENKRRFIFTADYKF